jgi:hypothetical protein
MANPQAPATNLPIWDNLKSLADMADGLLKVLALIALTYILLMGLIYRAGSFWGTETGEQQRQQQGKPVLKDLPEDDKPVLFWNDEKLIQGGLTGFVVVAGFSSYVVFMALFSPNRRRLSASVIGLMPFTNMSLAFVVLVGLYPLRHEAEYSQWAMAIMSAATVPASLYIGVKAPPNGLRNQAVILLLNSFLSCYALGAAIGLHDVDFESRFPLVEVVTTDAQTLTGLRMVKTGDTECRFVRADGTEYLIPKAQIRYVRNIAAAVPVPAAK